MKIKCLFRVLVTTGLSIRPAEHLTCTASYEMRHKDLL